MSKCQEGRTRWGRQATWDHRNVSNKHVFDTFGKTLEKWNPQQDSCLSGGRYSHERPKLIRYEIE
ncbi:unnamed protein product [Sphenostylis stenocarpa]|uniref:Uncharacterized protein n=1 Tax=Sphenostylis stenocarpa TaxID=92480 RepID=A0AA86SSE9_9FABA|nr:unnamed protein product [Sphenostylis stenocarpa]